MTTLLDIRTPRAALVLLCLLLWLPGFWTLPPGDRDESRFVQATRQMLETGDFVRIRNGEEERNRKPIGIHWLQAPFAALAQRAGVATADPAWPYRIPSLLGGLVGVLACHAAGRRLLGARAGLLGAGMLAASVLLVGEVHIAKTDAALLGATTLAMAVLARAYLDPAAVGRGLAALFWLALGVGVLLKGPITPMVAGLAVIALLVAEREAGWLACLRWRWGVVLAAAVVVPWFVAIGLATEGRFFADAVGGDLGRKLASGDDSHWGPPGLHLALLALLSFPSAAALPAGATCAWRGRGRPQVRFLLAWLVPAWLVFEAAPTKLPHYPLPLYPALCLLMAQGVLEGAALPAPALLWRGRLAPLWRGLGPVLGALGAAALGAGAIAAPALLGLGWWLGLPGLAAAALVGWFAVRGPDLRAQIGAILAAILAYAAILGGEAPRLTPLWIAPRVVAALGCGPAAPCQVGAVGFAEPSLMVMAGTATRWLRPEQAAEALARGEVRALVVEARELGAVRAALARRGVAVREAGVVRGFNYSRGRPVTLTLIEPAPAPAAPAPTAPN